MTAQAKADPTKQMLEYLMEKTGTNEAAILQEMYKDRMMDLAARATIGELVEVAEKEGWLEVLYRTRFVTLMPARAEKKAPSGKARLSKDEVEELQNSIIGFLKKNPGSKIGEIVKGVGYEATKIRPQLLKLKEAKAVTSKGSKAATVYSAK